MLYLERIVLDITLYRWLLPITPNKPLHIKDGVLRVRGQLVLGSISNQTFTIRGEGHIGRGNTISLVIGDDIHTSILEHTNTIEREN